MNLSVDFGEDDIILMKGRVGGCDITELKPQKSNIDIKNGHILKESTFSKTFFGVSSR